MYIYEADDLALKHISLPVLCICMVTGNSLLLYIILSRKVLRTVTNTFVLSLALSDLLLGLVVLPLMVLAEAGVLGRSPMACLGVFSVAIAQVLVSCLTMLVIALERFLAITRPLHHHAFLTTTRAFIIIICVWVYSCLVGALPLLGWNALGAWGSDNSTGTSQNGDMDTHTAYRERHDPVTDSPLSSTESWERQAVSTTSTPCRYNTVVGGSFAAFMYPGHFTPLWLAMIVLYAHIYMRSRNQHSSTKVRRLSMCMHKRHQNSVRTRENWRAIRVLAVVVGYFILSWLPVIVWYGLLYDGFRTEYALRNKPRGLPMWFYNVSITLAFGNSAVNPFLYGLASRGIRREWKKMCVCWGDSLRATCCPTAWRTDRASSVQSALPLVGSGRPGDTMPNGQCIMAEKSTQETGL